MTKHIQVGKIINTHGIKGDVKIMPLTEDKNRFKKLEYIYIEGIEEKMFIEKVWFKKNFPILKLKGYNNINDVLKFKEKYLLIDETQKVELSEDEYFIYDMIGLEVYDNEKNKIGVIKDVLKPGANDVYVVKNGNKEYLIPAAKEFIKKVDIEAGKMIIQPIEGMIE
ncbi:ribosome maturation factor RimM [Dethiothermospora halolimnae]|uniref:ribosome maturation factor RimM n=1 Tax=Dethiothermospora halolimnae TaxID=3114390 RepID=UPI003CCBE655